MSRWSTNRRPFPIVPPEGPWGRNRETYARAVDVRAIGERETRPLRQRVLRQHQTLDELAPRFETGVDGYFGAFVNGELVGVVIVQPEEREGTSAQIPWRLTAMAVVPEHQRLGVGKQLVQKALDHIRTHGGDEVWCHGRTGALEFYAARGFRPVGDEFVEPHTGPHYLMVRPL